MENINVIKFFIIAVAFSTVVIGFLLNNLVSEYKEKEVKHTKIITELSKENYDLKVYKIKKEFSKKLINNFKDAAKKSK